MDAGAGDGAGEGEGARDGVGTGVGAGARVRVDATLGDGSRCFAPFTGVNEPRRLTTSSAKFATAAEPEAVSSPVTIDARGACNMFNDGGRMDEASTDGEGGGSAAAFFSGVVGGGVGGGVPSSFTRDRRGGGGGDGCEASTEDDISSLAATRDFEDRARSSLGSALAGL